MFARIGLGKNCLVILEDRVDSTWTKGLLNVAEPKIDVGFHCVEQFGLSDCPLSRLPAPGVSRHELSNFATGHWQSPTSGDHMMLNLGEKPNKLN